MSLFTIDNPVLLREIRERVSARRTMFIFTLWLLLLSVIVAVYYLVQTGQNFADPFNGGIGQLSRIGQALFEWVLFFMTGLVLFLVPGFTAASIAGERERQTLLPLQVTLVRPFSIIWGKVAASVAFTLLLLAATLPLLAFAYLIGGIQIMEVFRGLAMVAFSAIALACITVACSALVKRVQGAIVLAYGLVLAMVVGSFVAFGLAAMIDDSQGVDPVEPPAYLLATNPLVAVAEVSGSSQFDVWGGPRVEGPLSAIREMLKPTVDHHDHGHAEPVFIDGPFGVPVDGPNVVGFDQFGNPIIGEDAEGDGDGFPFWGLYLVVMTGVSAVALWIATRRVRTPAKVER